MKKRCIAALFALVAAVSLAAQTGGGGSAGLLNVENYSKLFLSAGGLCGLRGNANPALPGFPGKYLF
jgi:hypothetical protein